MDNFENGVTPIPNDPQPKQHNKWTKIRPLVAYWILGLCNNYGYVVMLTAAADIIGESSQSSVSSVRKLANFTNHL